MQASGEGEGSNRSIVASDGELSDDHPMPDQDDETQADEEVETSAAEPLNKPVRTEVRLTGTDWATSAYHARSHVLPERFKEKAVPTPPGTLTFHSNIFHSLICAGGDFLNMRKADLVADDPFKKVTTEVGALEEIHVDVPDLEMEIDVEPPVSPQPQPSPPPDYPAPDTIRSPPLSNVLLLEGVQNQNRTASSPSDIRRTHMTNPDDSANTRAAGALEVAKANTAILVTRINSIREEFEALCQQEQRGDPVGDLGVTASTIERLIESFLGVMAVLADTIAIIQHSPPDCATLPTTLDPLVGVIARLDELSAETARTQFDSETLSQQLHRTQQRVAALDSRMDCMPTEFGSHVEPLFTRLRTDIADSVRVTVGDIAGAIHDFVQGFRANGGRVDHEALDVLLETLSVAMEWRLNRNPPSEILQLNEGLDATTRRLKVLEQAFTEHLAERKVEQVGAQPPTSSMSTPTTQVSQPAAHRSPNVDAALAGISEVSPQMAVIFNDFAHQLETLKRRITGIEVRVETLEEHMQRAPHPSDTTRTRTEDDLDELAERIRAKLQEEHSQRANARLATQIDELVRERIANLGTRDGASSAIGVPRSERSPQVSWGHSTSSVFSGVQFGWGTNPRSEKDDRKN